MMTKLLALTIVGAVLTAAPTPLPQAGSVQPPFQNAKVEPRNATSIDRELASLGAGPDPVWFGWRVPMIDGDRRSCDTWINNDAYYRGYVMESRGDTPPAAPPAGPVRLEGGTGLVVFVRMINGNVERLRSLDDSCPVDGGGRTVYWLNGITPAESLRYLQTFTQADGLNIDTRRNLASNALSAIALHRDPGADAVLDRLADSSGSALRSSAISRLGNDRGAHGFDKLKTMLAAERESSARQTLVSAIGSTRQPGTADLLLNLARTDTDPKVRASAVSGYARAAGPAGISNVVAIIESDRDDSVKTRAVSGLSSLPGGAGIEPLLKVARSSKNLAVTKAAVSALSSSKDPRALAYMEELVKR